MTVTYKTLWPDMPKFKVPVLHRVVYDRRDKEVVLAMYQYSYKDHLVNDWLKENCQCPYYHSPGWMKEKFIEFECDEEAVMFALRFA